MKLSTSLAVATLALCLPFAAGAKPPAGYQYVYQHPYYYCWKPAHANAKRGRWVWRNDCYVWVPARKFAAGFGPRTPGHVRASSDRFPEDRAGLYQLPDGRWVREGYAHIREKPAR